MKRDWGAFAVAKIKPDEVFNTKNSSVDFSHRYRPFLFRRTCITTRSAEEKIGSIAKLLMVPKKRSTIIALRHGSYDIGSETGTWIILLLVPTVKR